jgi:hypothetical protein
MNAAANFAIVTGHLGRVVTLTVIAVDLLADR